MSRRLDPASALRPYDPERQPWTRREAGHLLRRLQFGATHEEIEQATRVGLRPTLERLLNPQPESSTFQSTENLLRRVALDTGEINDLKAWWLYRMGKSANPLVEKLTLFWHNHFATSNAKVQSVRHMAAQNDLMRRQAFGSFRQLLHGMARDVALLIWLDGNANRKRHPNENFARELFELFSLGAGHYTETDIQQAARAFTGWHVRQGQFWFNRLQHDFGRKHILGKSGRLDGEDVIDVCLDHPACPRWLAAKLLTAFVTPAPEADWIELLARRIRAHDFEMSGVLRELFASQLFYCAEVRQAIIKSPLDFVLGSQRALGVKPNWQAIIPLLAELGQDIFAPPTVEGWEGGRFWIHSTTLLKRINFVSELLAGNRFGTRVSAWEPVKVQRGMTSQALVKQSVEFLLARDLEPAVLGQLEDFFDHLNGDRNERLRSLIQLIMTMPEYQLV